MDAVARLAVYGSLAPGRVNHDQLAGLDGRWFPGHVHGVLHDEGWGHALGYPVLVTDANGPRVDVLVFESSALPEHWARLDDFEGVGYRRVTVCVHTDDGEVVAQLYARRD